MPRPPVKTHTFATGKRTIHECRLLGICEMPDDDDKRLNMYIPEGGSTEALATTIHECMHAGGIPAKYLDGAVDPAEACARLLKRLGWVRMMED
jgi:hypothetical protein